MTTEPNYGQIAKEAFLEPWAPEKGAPIKAWDKSAQAVITAYREREMKDKQPTMEFFREDGSMTEPPIITIDGVRYRMLPVGTMTKEGDRWWNPDMGMGHYEPWPVLAPHTMSTSVTIKLLRPIPDVVGDFAICPHCKTDAVPTGRCLCGKTTYRPVAVGNPPVRKTVSELESLRSRLFFATAAIAELQKQASQATEERDQAWKDIETFNTARERAEAERDVARSSFQSCHERELAALKSQSSPWISVKERMPEETKDPDGGTTCVFVHHKHAPECSSPFQMSNVVYLRKHPEEYTHWMPIPPLPTETEDEAEIEAQVAWKNAKHEQMKNFTKHEFFIEGYRAAMSKPEGEGLGS